jgi:hypothetical protein
MAVSIADITSASISGSIVTTLTTPAFTVTANANRAGLLGLGQDTNTATGFTGSIGGVAGAAIALADSTTLAIASRTLMFGVTAPPSGSQTGTMSWVTASDAILGAMTTSGVDQTTPFNNGISATAVPGPTTITITSTNGDLTTDAVGADGAAFSAPTQTSVWANTTAAPLAGAGSRGPGTGTTTHQWTVGTGASAWVAVGVNWRQFVGGAPAVKPKPPRVLLQAMNRGML